MKRWGSGERFARDHRRHPRRGARRRVPLVVHRRLPGRDRSRSRGAARVPRRRAARLGRLLRVLARGRHRGRRHGRRRSTTSLVHERLRECAEVQEPITAAARAALLGRGGRRARRRRRRRRRRSSAARTARHPRSTASCGWSAATCSPARARSCARDGVRRRRPRPRREGVAVTAAAAAAADAARRSGSGRARSRRPRTSSRCCRIVVAVPTLVLIRRRGLELARRSGCGSRSPRATASTAGSRGATARRARARSSIRSPTSSSCSAASRCSPTAACSRGGRCVLIAAREFGISRVPVDRGPARRSCSRRSGSASTRRSRSTARSASCCCRGPPTTTASSSRRARRSPSCSPSCPGSRSCAAATSTGSVRRASESDGQMRCEVLAIGTELLLGQIVDTNSAWIGEQLAASGIDSYEHRVDRRQPGAHRRRAARPALAFRRGARSAAGSARPRTTSRATRSPS